MEKLVFPAHIGDLKYIIPALQVYYEANDWIDNESYIYEEFSILKNNGVESVMKSDRTDYTKDAELLRYFGFVERDPSHNSYSRITDSGRKFYESYKNDNIVDLMESMMTAFESSIFGRNNDGCPSSNTKLEAPNILLISALILEGITRIEYAAILYEMLRNNGNIINAIAHVKFLRDSEAEIKEHVRVDNKIVPFLINIGFLSDYNRKIYLSDYVRTTFRDRIANLRVTNDIVVTQNPIELDYKENSDQTSDFQETEDFIDFNIAEILNKIKNSGLIYNDSLIYRYAISLMTKPFVILSGLAGSGKTQLALAFANCLVENEEEQICFVPVGADWTNREPLLGYPSALDEKKYIKPESGVLDIILRAKENPQKPYFLILDEMNLSYVERYFADFLSAMEAHKKISLWKGDEHVPANVELPKNLFITGTINVDETTYMFSPKVLDRANVIEFKIDKEDIKKFFEESPNPQPSILVGKASSMAYSFVEVSNNDRALDSEANDVLLNFFEELKKVNSEFGYRVAVEIGRFISIAKEYNGHSEFDLDSYVDFAIIQKLLPKLHGSRKRLDKTLTTLWDLCQKDGGKKIYEATFEDAKNAKYEESANKILRMYNAANENGFTSFAEA